MPASELDRKFDAVLAAVTGPGGQIVIDQDAEGRDIVANFPATLPAFFKVFCSLNGTVEAVVSGPERLNFATLDTLSDRLARGLVARGVAKGDRVGIAMRNCPSWILGYMAALKAGAIATLINGWWQVGELSHALALTKPALILADEPRARRIASTEGAYDVLTIAIELPLEAAFADFLAAGRDDTALPDIVPEDFATILFTSGSTGEAKGALSTHRAVTTAVYSYATSLMTLSECSEGKYVHKFYFGFGYGLFGPPTCKPFLGSNCFINFFRSSFNNYIVSDFWHNLIV